MFLYVENRGQGKHVVLFKTPKIKINVTKCNAIPFVNYTNISELDAIHVHLYAYVIQLMCTDNV